MNQEDWKNKKKTKEINKIIKKITLTFKTWGFITKIFIFCKFRSTQNHKCKAQNDSKFTAHSKFDLPIQLTVKYSHLRQIDYKRLNVTYYNQSLTILLDSVITVHKSSRRTKPRTMVYLYKETLITRERIPTIPSLTRPFELY